MACGGCGAKYKRAGGVNRRHLNLPSKYIGLQKRNKKSPVPAPVTPTKTDPQTAIGLMSIIANSVPK